MTTRVHIHNWLQRVILLLLVLTGSLPTMAQDDEYYVVGDAFFVYQNDGHFDGFFVDDVKQMSYSRLDTLGREHDHYVSQEIVTADSTYRIMLTAIDSVSFVQPLNLLQENVKMMEWEGMTDYFITSLDMQLAFDLSMPDKLRPKVGDVLACPELEGHEGAFVGKVTSVRERGGFLVVGCDYVDKLSDVFDRFVGIEQVTNIQNAYGSRTLHRVSAMPPQMARAKARKLIEGNVDEFTLFAFDTSLSGTVELGKVKLGLAVNAGFGMTINAAYNIGWDRFYVKQEVKEQVAAGLTVSLDGELYNNPDLTAIPGVGALLKRFSRVPFPANFPILYANVTPTPFARAEAHLVLNVSSGLQLQALAQSVELKDSWPFISVKMNPAAPFLPLPSTLKPDGSFSISAQLNGTFQTGMKFPLEIGVESWLHKLVNANLKHELYAGPKVYGQLNFDLLKSLKGAYESLSDSKIDLSLMSFDSEFSGNGSILGHKTEVKRVNSWKYGNYTLKLFPDIDDVNIELTGDLQNVVKCNFSTKGDVCLPEQVGFALYARENKDSKDYDKLVRRAVRNETYFLNTFNGVDLRIEEIEPGDYMVRPIVVAPFGVVPVYKGEQLVTVPQKELMLKPDHIQTEEQGGTYEVEVLGSLDMPINAYPQDDWITCDVKYNVGGTRSTILYVTVTENNTDHYRHGTVLVRMRLKTDEVVERTLDVYQFGGLELDPKVLTFYAKDRKRQVEVLTSYKPITISVPEDAKEWLTVEKEGRMIYIYAEENKGANRQTTITVSAWSEKYKGISTVDLLVKQEGLVDVTLSKQHLKFAPNGGGERVNLDMGGNYRFTGIDIRYDGQDWLTAERGSNYFIVNCMPNESGEERASYVYLTFTKANADVKGPDTYEIPVLVEQELGGTPPGPGPNVGEQLDISKFRFTFSANLKQTYDSDPEVRWNFGYGTYPVVNYWLELGQGTNYELGDQVKATLGENAIHFDCLVKSQYTDEREMAFSEEPWDVTSTATIKFDVEKYKDENGKTAARITNVKLDYDGKEAYGGDYELHHIVVDVDPSKFKATIGETTEFVNFVDGHLVFETVGYNSIELASVGYYDGVEASKGLVVNSVEKNWKFYYTDYHDNNVVHENRYVYDRDQNEAKLYIEIRFPAGDTQAKLMEWFKK